MDYGASTEFIFQSKRLLNEIIGQKMECEVKADDKFCINISYKNEEDEKFYVVSIYNFH